MTPPDAVRDHQQLCDEIHRCMQEENRFLRTERRAPDAPLLERKRALLRRLDGVLAALRAVPSASARDPALRAQLEDTRARILQILQLDKENEQLLLRCSLDSTRPAGTPEGAVPPSVALLRRIYARCA